MDHLIKIWEYFLKSSQSILVSIKVSRSYEHFIIMRDFNINVTNRMVELDKLEEF